MLELGKNSIKMHTEITKVLKKVNPDIIFTVGKDSINIKKNLPKELQSFHFTNYEKKFYSTSKNFKNNDLIMVKGSNSSKVNLISKQILGSE